MLSTRNSKMNKARMYDIDDGIDVQRIRCTLELKVYFSLESRDPYIIKKPTPYPKFIQRLKILPLCLHPLTSIVLKTASFWSFCFSSTLWYHMVQFQNLLFKYTLYIIYLRCIHFEAYSFNSFILLDEYYLPYIICCCCCRFSRVRLCAIP